MKVEFSFFLLSLLWISILANDDQRLRASRRLQLFDGECTAVIKDVMYADDDPYAPSQTSYLQCMTPEGYFYDVPSASEDFINDHFVRGKFVSGETRLDLASGTMLDMASYELLIPAESIHLSPIHKDESRRRLSTGNKSVLIVKVIASDDQNSYSEATLSDSILGTSGDPVNMASQYSACSHGKLTFSPASDRTGSSVNISSGVVSITVGTSTSQGDGAMNNAVADEIYSQFGSYGYSIASHVLYCLPPNTMSGIAYAYINSYLSVYSDDWCTYMSVLLHELGHNLGLGHSGDGSNEYADQSGMMGYSYSNDDTPLMCFNAAKMWQLGWFTRTLELDSSGTKEYSGGIADMTQDPDSGTSPIVVKLNTPSSDDYFLSYNRQTGFNSGTLLGGNQVRIVQTSGGSGTSYSESTIMSSLGSGGSWTSSADFSGESVTVTVNSLGTEANVDICIGTCSGTPVTSPPTSSPVISPPQTIPPVSTPPVTSPPITNIPIPSPPTSSPITSPPTIGVPPISNPPFTSPPVTSPPVTSPPQTVPPVSNPPVTGPPVTSPPVTGPPVTSPPVTSPPVTSPPVSSPTNSPTSNDDDGCIDTTLKFLVNSRLRNCAWVAKNNTTRRCNLGGGAVATHCPLTCNECAQYGCVDATKRFRLTNGNLKSCSWVKRKNTASRCNKTGVTTTCRSTCSSTLCPGGV